MKKRIDVLLVEQALFTSRSKAHAAIKSGHIYNKTKAAFITKPSLLVSDDDVIEIQGDILPYVSRGGLKLQAAIEAFKIDLTDSIVADIGSSTGGFTDCALQHGAKQVYAIDVGHDQLVQSLRDHGAVTVMEQLNIKDVEQAMFTNGEPNFFVTDVSFISVKVVLQQVHRIMEDKTFRMVALIKPQFEAGPKHLNKQGVVRDKKVHQQVIDDIIQYIKAFDWEVNGMVASPITGAKGNQEFLVYFQKR